MKANSKLFYSLPFSLLLTACSNIEIKEERLETFGTGLPEDKVEAISTEYENKALSLNNSGLSDQDNDGVIDARDKCDDKLDDILVDNNGCPEQLSKVTTKNLSIQFDTSSTKIKPEYLKELETLASLHQKSPNHKILIEGHTDSTGSHSENTTLSKARADAVALALIEQYSVSKESILTAGFGPDDPIADNDTANGREKNRRIVAHVVFEDRIIQHQWNIWSVELGDKQSEVKQYYLLEGIK